MISQTPSIEAVRGAIDRLVAANRLTCLWYMRRDFTPANDIERLQALHGIERHGGREAYIEARELREWLLRASNDTSSAS